MSTTQQPEALRLADKYEAHGFLGDHRFAQNEWCRQAAAELRRLHAQLEASQKSNIEWGIANIKLCAEIDELQEQMAAIGAGGVEPLRKQASTADVADERDAFEKWLRIKPCGAAHDFGWEAWKARASLAATPAAGELATLQAGLQAGLQAAAPAVLPEPVPSGMRLVNAGALQMVINALRRDAEEGKAVRGEMADELLATGGQAQADARDAARYRWLRNQMLGVDFDWCGNGITALVFEVPDGCAYSRNCDQSIDTAIAAQAKKGNAQQ